ncbi:hypothetical protein ABZ619_39040 [Streptomyces sp. NPDC007851]|uniref:hypothetical protein n=1 Tax=Streptomyces sp. NPDC007851 TaxID=3155008 RepID=UPI0033ECCC8B
MSGTVVIVTRGRKYHADRTCPRLVQGEYLWDFDSDDYPAKSLRRREPNPQRAAMCGKLPCLYCVPAELRVFPPLYGQTFGHEPFVYDGVPICRRCYVDVTHCSIDAFEQPRPVRVRETVPWPCTSALVLGLVERPAAVEAVR